MSRYPFSDTGPSSQYPFPVYRRDSLDGRGRALSGSRGAYHYAHYGARPHEAYRTNSMYPAHGSAYYPHAGRSRSTGHGNHYTYAPHSYDPNRSHHYSRGTSVPRVVYPQVQPVVINLPRRHRRHSNPDSHPQFRSHSYSQSRPHHRSSTYRQPRPRYRSSSLPSAKSPTKHYPLYPSKPQSSHPSSYQPHSRQHITSFTGYIRRLFGLSPSKQSDARRHYVSFPGLGHDTQHSSKHATRTGPWFFGAVHRKRYVDEHGRDVDHRGRVIHRY